MRISLKWKHIVSGYWCGYRLTWQVVQWQFYVGFWDGINFKYLNHKKSISWQKYHKFYGKTNSNQIC